MEQHRLSYEKGINKDSAKDKYASGAYYHADNVKVITNDGLSSGSIENEDGNKLLFKFPITPARYKITFDNYLTFTHSGTIDINGVIITITNKTYKDVADEIKSNFPTEISNNTLYISHNNTEIIFSPLVNSFILNTSGDADSTVYIKESVANHICGWTRLNEWIVVFTSESTDEEPVNADCRIWKFKFRNDDFSEIEGINTSTLELVNSEHLIYNDILNYSTHKYITDTEVRYENDETGRVVFTDYFNLLRYINIFSPDTLGFKPFQLDISPDVIFSRPNIVKIEDAGSLPAGSTVQYGYRLLNSEGALTDISPLSHIMQLETLNTNDSSIEGNDFVYSQPNTSNNKSVEIEISDIDTSFSIIQVFCILRSFQDVALITQFNERSIPSSGNISIIHTGNETDVLEFTPEEFNGLSTSFSCKTISSDDNRLVAANIIEPRFDIDFDARAYRFGINSTNLILKNKRTNQNDAFDISSVANFNNIPEDHDAICLANDPINPESPEYALGSTPHLYQRNNTVLGGTGINVSYQFGEVFMTGTGNSPRVVIPNNEDEDYNKPEGRKSPDEFTSWGELAKDGNSIQFNINNELDSFHSPKLTAYFKGHARGEVYRYGVVFYNKKGQSSFVKWIGDIKFPEPKDGFPIGTATDKKGLTVTELRNLGINFTIDVSSIKNDITGFKIVRVERTQSDKTRLGTGIWNLFDIQWTEAPLDYSGTLPNPTYATLINRYFKHRGNPGNREELENITNIFGTDYGPTGFSGYALHLPCTPMKSDWILGSPPSFFDIPAKPYYKRFGTFQSPLLDYKKFNKYNFGSNHYIRDFGFYSCEDIAYNDDRRNGEQSTADDASFGEISNVSKCNTAFYYKARKWFPESTQKFFNYGFATAPKSMYRGESFLQDQPENLNQYLINSVPAERSVHHLINATHPDRSRRSPLGIGCNQDLLILKALNSGGTADILKPEYEDYAEDLVTHSPDEPNGGKNWTQDDVNASWYMKEVAYCSRVTNQYGGDTFEERSKNIYIDTGHYQIITEYMPNSYNFNVWGGDTYVHTFDKEFIHQHWNGLFPEGFNDGVLYEDLNNSQPRMGVSYIFPCETDYPFFLDSNYRWGRKRRGSLTDLAGVPKNDFTILDNRTEAPSKYFQQNNIRTNLIALDFLANNNNVFKNRFRISSPKIDGSLIDQWREFLSLNFKDIEGKYGQINKIIYGSNNNLFYFQDRAHGVQPINERSLIQDNSTNSLTLGTGLLLGKNQYLSTLSGTSHQQSVVLTPRGLYYWDSSNKSINNIQGVELSKMSGLIGYFPNYIQDSLLSQDLPHVIDKASVVAEYDIRHNRVLFTFQNCIKYPEVTFLSTQEFVTTLNYYKPLDRVVILGELYECLVQGNYSFNNIPSSDKWILKRHSSTTSVTLAFNELLNAFESFYDYTPTRYLNINNELLSINPSNNSDGWVHTSKANKCNYYGNVYNSEIIFLVNPSGKYISIMDNIEYLSEVSLEGQDITTETVDYIHVWNEYQNSNLVNLVNDSTVKRYFRTWRTAVPRDLTDVKSPRIRNYYMMMKLTYLNNNNKKLIINDIFVKHRLTRI